MKILLLSYGDFEYDGRLRELCKVYSNLGELTVFSRGSAPKLENHIICNLPYLKFIKSAVSFAKEMGQVDILVLDNRKSVIPGLRIKKIYKSAKIILDCRELYLSKYVKHFAGKVGCFFEKKGIKKADIIVCANNERANFMKDYYKLKNTPLVFDNLRKLEFSKEYNQKEIEEKFKTLINDGEFRLISTSACEVARTNDILVKNLPKVNAKIRLFMVGSSTEEDKTTIEKIISSLGIENVSIIGRLNQNELKYLIGKCHIGIVNYHQLDLNNKFCASGKIFEFLYEGLPVVTTTNPPLKNMCDTFKVGECDDEYYNAINKVIESYDFYKENVKKYCESHNVFDNNESFIGNVKTLLKIDK